MLVLGATVGGSPSRSLFLDPQKTRISLFSLEREGFYGFGTSKSFGGVLTMKAVAL
jgi:hypothetical protein